MLLAPTVGARNLLKHKAKEDVKKAEEKGEVVSLSAKELLQMTQKNFQTQMAQVKKCFNNFYSIKFI